MKQIFHHIILIIITIPAFSISSHAQNAAGGEIKGRTEGKTGQPVTFSTVTLLKASDSSLVKGAISDEGGEFEFENLPAGAYLVAASSIGLQRTFSKVVTMDESSHILLAPLVLLPNTNTLKGVNVTATKPFIEHKLDKTVMNVENSIVSAGNTALEVLEKAPGVMVDNNGNISLKGKNGVTIMIDGKPTYLSQEQVTNMLKSMSASQLSQIEIITNPSARYDAAGTAGIINIKLKKNANEGMNGSVTLGYSQGIHSRENGDINLNYKKGKVNLFGNYSLSDGASGHVFRLTRKFYSENSKLPNTIMTQHSPRRSSSTYQSFKAGMDYSIDKKNTIGVMVNAAYNNRSSRNYGPLNFYNGNNQLDSTAVPNGHSKDTWNSVTYNLNYKLEMDTSGQELTANFDYSLFNSGSHQTYSTGYLDADGNEMHDTKYRRGSLPSDIDIKSGKIDYTLPFKNKMKLEAGIKSSIVTSDNNVQYENKVQEQWQNDAGASNHFIYKENINAAYINLSKEFKHGWALQMGLRGEQTISKANQLTIDSVVERNYFQLFPSLFVKKDLDKNNTLTASYSHRIDRPDYHDLNPFRYYIDDYTYGEGNPFLQPQLTNSFELSHSFKGMINTTLSYSHTTDVMANVIRQNDATHTAYETKDNLNTLDNMGLSVSVPVQVTKWWMSNDFANVFRNRYKGQLNGGQFDKGVTSFGFHSTNTFTLPWDMKAELSGYYNSKSVYSVWVGDPQYSISAGLQKSFWDKRANLKLNVNDIFDTQQYKGRLRYQNIDMRIHNTWESRRVGLTFTYNFGNRNMKTDQRHKTGIEDEQNRINK